MKRGISQVERNVYIFYGFFLTQYVPGNFYSCKLIIKTWVDFVYSL